MNNSNNVFWVLIVVLVVGGLAYLGFGQQKSANLPPEENTINMNKNIDGLKITVLQEGTGEPAKAGNNVSMNYTGTLLDGTGFDSNVDPQFGHVQPFIFTLGAGQVIRGWDLGVEGMRIGEKRKLEIAPELAYGANGVGEIIPPNSTLIFEVELLSINN